MTATNHAITGATIGLLVSSPLIALPLALLSHFICDALPHFDKPDQTSVDNWLKSKTFRTILTADAIGCIILVLTLASHHPVHWLQASIGAFLATSPDLLWINRFIKARKDQSWKPSSFSKFASAVQWFAKPIGGVVEIVWFGAGLYIISSYWR